MEAANGGLGELEVMAVEYVGRDKVVWLGGEVSAELLAFHSRGSRPLGLSILRKESRYNLLKHYVGCCYIENAALQEDKTFAPLF